TEIDRVTADGNGKWSYVADTSGHGTTHVFSAVAVDAAGNESLASKAVEVMIDIVAPAIDTITRDDIELRYASESIPIVIRYADTGSRIDTSTISRTDIVVHGPAGTLDAFVGNIETGTDAVT